MVNFLIACCSNKPVPAHQSLVTYESVTFGIFLRSSAPCSEWKLKRFISNGLPY